MDGDSLLHLDEISSNIRILEQRLHVSKDFKQLTGCFYTPLFVVKTMFDDSFLKILKDILLHAKFPSFRFIKQDNLVSFLSALSQDESFYILEKLPTISIADIAMGWGIFLLYAFDQLYFLYKSLIKKLSLSIADLPFDFRMSFDALDLAIAEIIITKNLYGSDISPLAIQLSKLLFYKKLLRLFNAKTLNLPFKFNFVVGDSLLGASFNNTANNLLDKASCDFDFNIVNWSVIFPHIHHNNGFNLVIGNPPYINVKKIPFKKRKCYKQLYCSYNANGDISNIFIERAIDLCRDGGYVSFITPRYWLEGTNSRNLRHFILNSSTICKIIDFRSNRTIFSTRKYRVGIDTLIILLKKQKISANYNIDIYTLRTERKLNINNYSIDYNCFKHHTVQSHLLTSNKWIFERNRIIEYLEENYDYRLGNIENEKGIALAGKGCSTGNNAIFELEHVKGNIYRNFMGKTFTLNPNEINSLRLLIKTKDINQYWWHRGKKYWIFLKDRELSKFPSISKHLKQFQNKLEQTKQKYNLKNFYDYAAYRSLDLIQQTPKIIGPYQAKENRFAIVLPSDPLTIYESDVVTVRLKDQFKETVDYYYLLAVLNSTIIKYYSTIMNKKVYRLYDFRPKQLNSFPIVIPDNDNSISHLTNILVTLYYARHNTGLFSNRETNKNEWLIALLKDLIDILICEQYFFDILGSNLNILVNEFINTKTNSEENSTDSTFIHELENFLSSYEVKREINRIRNHSYVQTIFSL